VHTDILLPNDLFSNTYKTKEGDTGNGILDIFDRYNFTVKEDEPLEKEVAVDPEMLGKVFENLLEVKDRKSKGTYYTPREIVHYMCQESLSNYLTTELEGKVSKEDIGMLIKYGETAVEHDSRVVNEGRETETYSFKLPESIRTHAKLIDEELASIRVCDPAVGSGAFPVGMMNEVIRTRNALSNYIQGKNGRSIYDFKRHAIQNCLYGVDIDLSAVEIAKLRLWLSLIVDEEDIKQIKPLPNLDYKIVQGNSLLGVEKNLFNMEQFNKLEELKPLFFNETNMREKQAYKDQIDKLISQITNGRKDFDFEVYFSEVFHEKRGFDVVIANPPYYQLSKDKKVEKQYKVNLRNKYGTSGGRLNTFIFFIHQGSFILAEEGVLSYIVPNTILTQEYYRDTRKLILEKMRLDTIVTYEDMPFEHAIVENVTLIIRNNTGVDYLIKIYSQDEQTINFLGEQHKSDFDIPPNYTINIQSDSIVEKIFSSDHEALSKHCHINQAIALKGDRSRSLSKKHLDTNYYKVLDGRDIHKYSIKWANVYLEYDLRRIHSCKRKDIFESKEKLFFRRVSANLIFAYDNKQFFALNTLVVVNKKEGSNLDLKYLLAVLNSTLLTYIYKIKFKSTKKVFSEIQARSVGMLPIKVVPKNEQNVIINIVNKLLAITEDKDYLENPAKQAKVSEFEKQIDQMVYKLYGLTEEEIKIVEKGSA
jgi:hypothetical protein